jgi:hypothetical protein
MSVGVVLLQVNILIGGEPPSWIAGQGSMLQAPESCWRWCYRDDVGCGVMSLPSHASDGAGEVTWPWRNVSAESMLVMVLLRQLDHGAMLVSSHAANDVAEATWPRCDIGAKSCWRWCCRGNLAVE